jgi:hypothetical protein
LNSINQLIFLMVTCGVFLEVRVEFLNISTSFGFKEVDYRYANIRQPMQLLGKDRMIGVRLPVSTDLSLGKRIQTGWAPPSLLSNRHDGPFPDIKWCGVKQTPPSSAEITNAWRYTPHPSIHLHGMIIKYTVTCSCCQALEQDTVPVNASQMRYSCGVPMVSQSVT